MNIPASLIAALEHCGMFQEYEQAYTELTGLPIALCPPDEWHLPFRGKRHENRFCALLASSNAACASCLRVQETLRRHAAHGPAKVTCKYGLQEIAVPVMLGHETIGFLLTGQLFQRPPNALRLKAIRRELKSLGAKPGCTDLLEIYLQSPVLSRKRLQAVIHLLSIFAEHLAVKSNQITISQANSEPFIASRGRHYIQEHLSERLTLKRVANAVNASTFHFCKVFRTATGVHFTEFVSRARVEKARDLLLNRHLQISEVAYRVGFQSLTHFNRMFRRITGQSPTQYRAEIAAFSSSLRAQSSAALRVGGSYEIRAAVPPRS